MLVISALEEQKYIPGLSGQSSLLGGLQSTERPSTPPPSSLSLMHTQGQFSRPDNQNPTHSKLEAAVHVSAAPAPLWGAGRCRFSQKLTSPLQYTALQKQAAKGEKSLPKAVLVL